MKDKSCLFCQIAQKKIPAKIVWENDNLMALVDIKPINLGHLLIISKQHFTDIFELPDNIWPQLGPAIVKLSQAVRKVTNADGINIGINNGQAAGQAIFHVHFHIIPRFTNDGYKNWANQKNFTEEDLERITQKISTYLN
jgi:histidine triad (HIT) family protein